MPAGSIIRSAKNKVCLFSSAQVKVREATSNDPDGPSKNILIEIAVLSQNPITLEEMLQILIKRINDDGKNWRHIHKSMMVFEFLCLCGNMKVINFCKRNRHLFESLKSFQHFDKEHRDFGANVRDKAYDFTAMLDDDEKLKEAQCNFDKSKTIDRGQLEFNRKISANSSPTHNVPDKIISVDIRDAIPTSREEEDLQFQKAIELSKKEDELTKSYQQSYIVTNHNIHTTTDEKKNVNLLDLDFMIQTPISQSQTSIESKPLYTNNISDGQINTYQNKSIMSNTDLFVTSQQSVVPNNTPNLFNSTTNDKDLFGFPIDPQKPIQHTPQYQQPIQPTLQYSHAVQPNLQYQYNISQQQYSQPYIPSYNIQHGQIGNTYNQPNIFINDQQKQSYMTNTNPFFDQSSSINYNNTVGSNPLLFTQPQQNPFQSSSSTTTFVQSTTNLPNNRNNQIDLFADLISPDFNKNNI